MPDGSTRVPALSRNAGGREFQTAADLNAYLTRLNAAGGIDGELLPLVSDDARFSDGFDSLDLRLSRSFAISPGLRLEAIVECFNVLNVTNILGVSKSNYSGFANVLARDSADPADPGYLRSSSFGQALTTAGGVFGSGGPRAFQLGAAGTVLSPEAAAELRRRVSRSRRRGPRRGRDGRGGDLPHPGRDGALARLPRALFLVWAFMGDNGDLRRAQLRRARRALSGGGRVATSTCGRPSGPRSRSSTDGSASS